MTEIEKLVLPTTPNDPNYGYARQFRVRTNGVIPTACTGALVANTIVLEGRPRPGYTTFQVSAPPVTASSEINLGSNRSDVIAAVEEARQQTRDIVETYGRAIKRTETDGWDERIAKFAGWRHDDEIVAAEQLWRRAYAEAVSTGNELWRTILERDKKIYYPPVPRTDDELDNHRTVGLGKDRWKVSADEDVASELGQLHESDAYNPDGDDESDSGFGTDGVSYDGVRDSNDHPDLQAVRASLRIKYGAFIERTKFMSYEERLAELRLERDANVDALRLLVLFKNRKIADMRPGGHDMKINTLIKQMGRATERTALAVNDHEDWQQSRAALFTRVINSMTGDKVHDTICPGGWFALVTLNDRTELKRLGLWDATISEANDALGKHLRTSVRKAVNYAEGKAHELKMGKQQTRAWVSDARNTVIEAYNDAYTDERFVRLRPSEQCFPEDFKKSHLRPHNPFDIKTLRRHLATDVTISTIGRG